MLNDLLDSSSPGREFFVMTILSCTNATFGLITTSTPWPAFVIKDTQIYDMPAGEIGLGLPQGSPVWVIMDERLDVDGVFWVKVRDVFQRSGWIGMQLLDIPNP